MMKKYNDFILENNIFDNIKFSDKFYLQDENIIEFRKKKYIDNLKSFIDFWNKYNPIGIRIFSGVDLYEASKEIYDNIIDGKVYVDDVFTDPDNPLRNIVMMLFLDEPMLKKKNKI